MKRGIVGSGLAVAIVGCGTLTAPGEGNRDLPVGRGGPYRLLGPSDLDGRACVVEEVGSSLDDPSAVPSGRDVTLFFTRERDGRRSIYRAFVSAELRAAVPIAEALGPSQRWHGASLASPSVRALPNRGLIMAYVAEGGIGIAESSDGSRWSDANAPALAQDPTAGEATALRGPNLVVDSDGSRWVFYESGAAIWAARSERGGAPFARVDSDPRTTRRDPALAPQGGGAIGGGVPSYLAGSVGDPELLVETTSSGRSLWRLFFTARGTPIAIDGGSRSEVVVGVAGSFDGRFFTPSVIPSLSSRVDATLSSPAVVTDGPLRAKLFVGGNCAFGVSRRGIRVAVLGSSPIPDAGP